VISEALKFQREKGLKFLLAVGAEAVEVGVDGSSKGREVFEMFVLKRALVEGFP